VSQELWRESALSLAAMIKSGETTSREVAEAHLARIEQVNGDVNAIVEIRPDDVRRDADAADAHQRAGNPLGTFHGVPFSVKTNIDVAGFATTAGSLKLKDVMASSDAVAVRRMKDAGAIVLGRTNMPDLGQRINTQSSLYGDTHNPWKHGLTAGGSSGGEGAALAAGMSPIGLGNDIGGSLRNPAFANGITSIKPTRGRVPQINATAQGMFPLSAQVMLAQGVMARRVADVSTGLQTIMGSDPTDPLSLSMPFNGSSAPKRVAMVAEPVGGATNPHIAEGVRAAARALEGAGYEVEEVPVPGLEDLYLNWIQFIMATAQHVAAYQEQVMGEDGLRFLRLTGGGINLSGEDLHNMHLKHFELASLWKQFMVEYPLILGPTWTQFPFPLNYDIESAETAFEVITNMRFVLPANALGLPAACVPAGIADGLPLGVQIIGDMFRDDLCLQAAQVVEDALGIITPIDPRF
jgi:amidase